MSRVTFIVFIPVKKISPWKYSNSSSSKYQKKNIASVKNKEYLIGNVSFSQTLLWILMRVVTFRFLRCKFDFNPKAPILDPNVRFFSKSQRQISFSADGYVLMICYGQFLIFMLTFFGVLAVQFTFLTSKKHCSRQSTYSNVTTRSM